MQQIQHEGGLVPSAWSNNEQIDEAGNGLFVPSMTCRTSDGELGSVLFWKLNIRSIPFKNGFPDFSAAAWATVKIKHMTADRYGQAGNFHQADTQLGQRLTPPVSADFVAFVRSSKGYTWHECEDLTTMQLVPQALHTMVPHRGGVSVYRHQVELCD